MNYSRIGLRVAMVLFRLAVIFTGLNRAFGGITTLGWQGPADFATIANQPVWLIQDNHTRFLGGVWTSVGLLMLVAQVNLRAAAPALYFAFAATFMGGLARFTSGQVGLMFGPELLLSVSLELVAMPLLALWLRSVVSREA